MATDGKDFPPSDLKLQRLRMEGVVAFSSDLLIPGILLGLFVAALAILSSEGMGLVEQLNQFSSELVPQPTQLREMFEFYGLALLKLIILATGFLLTFVVLIGAIQTRFLISWSAVSLNFGSLFNLVGLSPSSIVARLGYACTRLVIVITWLVVAVMVLRFLLFSLYEYGQLTEVNLGQEFTIPLGPKVSEARFLDFLEMGIAPWAATLTFALLLGGGSYFIAILNYRRAHKMSRQEIEDEYREQEASPEMRQAASDLERLTE